MGEVSNKTIAILVGVLIVISMAGLFIKGGITGAVTTDNDSNATVTITVQADVDIEVGDAAVSMGTLTPGENRNTSIVSSQFFEDHLALSNNGTSSVDIAWYASWNIFNKTCFTGTGDDARNEATDCFEGTALTNTTGTTATIVGIYSGSAYAQVPVLSENRTQIVESLEGDGQVNFGFNVTVPLNEPSGTKITVISFVGSEDT